MIGIYRIRNLVNNKCYYGSSKQIEKRWKNHKTSLIGNTHYNTLLQRAWNKYGEHNFVFEVVKECKEENLLLEEQKYLDKNPEYNIGKTSSGGDNLSKNPNKNIIVQKIKKSVNDRINLMTKEEKIEKFSLPMEKNPNWKGGISYTYCNCGKRISNGCTHCNKCAPKSGENNPFYGKTHSKETRSILREKRLGKKPSNIKPVSIDGTEYESLSDASKKTGINGTTILWRINSKNKKYSGYKYI